MVLIGCEMNKNVYEKTEVVFKMTWVGENKTKQNKTKQKKKKKKKKKKKHSGTKRLETIMIHSGNK